MTKLGAEYEQALAGVLRHFDGHAKISVGEIVKGPYGSRDIDVLLEGNIGGRFSRIAFECKDYHTSRKIGIEIVDAVVGKRSQLGVDLSIICSNAGFTEPARCMATAQGVGLVGIFKNNPKRPYSILDYFETRWVKIVGRGTVNYVYNGQAPLQTSESSDGVMLAEAAQKIFSLGVMRFGTISGAPEFHYTPRKLMPLKTENNELVEIRVSCPVVGMVMGKNRRISTDVGIYNWITKSLQSASNGGVTYHDVPVADISSYQKQARLPYIPQAADGVYFTGITLESFMKFEDLMRIGNHEIEMDGITLVSNSSSTIKSSSKVSVKKYIGRSVPQNVI